MCIVTEGVITVDRRLTSAPALKLEFVLHRVTYRQSFKIVQARGLLRLCRKHTELSAVSCVLKQSDT